MSRYYVEYDIKADAHSVYDLNQRPMEGMVAHRVAMFSGKAFDEICEVLAKAYRHNRKIRLR